MPRRLSDDQVLEMTMDDPKVQAALSAAVCLIFRMKSGNVDLKALKDVIEWRLGVWSEHEPDVECFDGDGEVA